MIENIERIGAFTSSMIYKLMTNGKKPGTIGAPGLTYIQERAIERKMGRSLDTESYSKEMTWGLFLEKRGHSLLPDFGYQLTSKQTDIHPKYKFWSGSKDLIMPLVKIGDIKCYQPKNFSILTDAILLKDIENFKKECPIFITACINNVIKNGQ